MKSFRFLTFILCILGFYFQSCNNTTDNNAGLSTDVVNNPISATESADTSDLPTLTFKNDLFDFGVIIEGEKVSHKFKYTNTGKTNLIISSVSASCGCTVLKNWSKEPLSPGKEEEIDVVFNSSGKKGTVTKKVTIYANTQPKRNVVKFTAQIITPDKK